MITDKSLLEDLKAEVKSLILERNVIGLLTLFSSIGFVFILLVLFYFGFPAIFLYALAKNAIPCG